MGIKMFQYYSGVALSYIPQWNIRLYHKRLVWLSSGHFFLSKFLKETWKFAFELFSLKMFSPIVVKNIVLIKKVHWKLKAEYLFLDKRRHHYSDCHVQQPLAGKGVWGLKKVFLGQQGRGKLIIFRKFR